MKFCSKCNIEKPLSEFRKWYKGKDGHQSACKTCAYAHHQKYYLTNKDKWAANEKKSIERARVVILEALSIGCGDCKTTDLRVLEFDHVNGDKTRDVSRLMNHGIPRIKEEIAKCEVVCKNCHAIRTYERAGSWRSTLGPFV